MKRNTVFGVTGFAVLTLIFLSAFKPAPGDHPLYIRALGDLRSARWSLEHKPGNWKRTTDELNAVGEIDKAINEIKKSHIDDGHDNNWDPRVKELGDHIGRLHAAADFLHKAHEDIKDEDMKWENGLKQRTLQHIDAAIANTEKAIRQ